MNSEIARVSPISCVHNVKLPLKPSNTRWNVHLKDGLIEKLEQSLPESLRHTTATDECHINGHGKLLAPALCHAHVHMDKCFLLHHEKYADLEIVKGDFQEAMSLTNEAKSRFQEDDLMERGHMFLQRSQRAGVTAMRAFVECDEIVQLKGLHAAKQLKKLYQGSIELQICAFAQLSLFSGPDGGAERRKLLLEAVSDPDVQVVGSTPYVEDSEEAGHQNISWVIETAIKYCKHVDFHLDYNIDPDMAPMVWFALDELNRQDWGAKAAKGKTICLGHCTRMSLFSDSEWKALRDLIGNLPVFIVGLPTSDLFMMGRQDELAFGQRPRGTLPIPKMIQDFGLNAAISLNNIGNAFTPQGTCDPLSVASLGVGVYQTATKQDTHHLYECVSTRAKTAIGLQASDLDITVDSSADFVLYESEDNNSTAPSLAQVVYTPMSKRTLVSSRLVHSTT